MVLLKGRTAARPNSRAPPFTYPRVRPLGYLPITGLDHFDTGNLLRPRLANQPLHSIAATLSSVLPQKVAKKRRAAGGTK